MTELVLPVTVVNGDQEADLVISASPSAKVSALLTELDEPSGVLLWNGVPLDPELLLADIGLIAGDRLVLEPKRVSESSRIWLGPTVRSDVDYFLVQIAGESAGRVIGLQRGTKLVVGSAPSRLTDGQVVVCDDPDVLAEAMWVETDGENIHLSPFASVVVNGTTKGESVTVVPGDIISIGQYVRFRVATGESATPPNDRGLVEFSPTGAQATEPIVPVEIRTPQPAREFENPDPPWLRMLYPLMSGAIILLVFKKWQLGALLVVPLIVGVFDWRWSGRKTRRRRLDEELRVKTEWNSLEQSIQAAAAAQAAVRLRAVPEKEDLYRASLRRQPGLWSVSETDEQFLAVRLGYGNLPATHEVRGNLTAAEGEKLRPLLDLVDVPVMFDLNAGHIAYTGSLSDTAASLSALLIQISTRFSPADVEMVICLPRIAEFAERLQWSKWLPHCRLAGDQLAVLVGRRRTETVLDHLAARWQEVPDSALSGQPHAVVVIHEAVEVSLALVDLLVSVGRGRVHLIWAGTSPDRVPVPIRTKISLSGQETVEGTVVTCQPDWEWAGRKFAVHLSDGPVPLTVARGLAPLFDPRGLGIGAGIPGHVGLRALIEALPRGQTAAEGLKVTLGSGSAGLCQVDLEEHGPHMVVGGTTGSGKSELLQTLISSILWQYSPDEVHVLLVDYKGGLAFGDFRSLPHVAGFVSDLTGSQADRVIAFLRREIERRKEILEGAKARDFATYRGVHGRRLARLVVVFDEFAAVLAARPQFIDAAVRIAQQGRALGVHLVMATQRPSGETVTADLRANVSIRVALRTLEQSDSISLINSPIAAKIPADMRGRSVLRLDDDRLLSFQSGHASNRADPVSMQPVRLDNFLLTGPGKVERDSEKLPTDLDWVIERIAESNPEAIQASPSLGEALDQLDLEPPPIPSGKSLQLGQGDDPLHQARPQFSLMEDAGALLLLGGLGRGKTHTLELLARQFSGDLIAIDGRRDLSLRLRGHGSASIVAAHDLERSTLVVDQILHRLSRNIAQTLLVLIDDIGVWTSSFERLQDGPLWTSRLATLLQASGSGGVRVVATARRPSEVPSLVRASFEEVIQFGVDHEADDFTGGKAVGLPTGQAIDVRSLVNLRIFPLSPTAMLSKRTAPSTYGRPPAVVPPSAIGIHEISREFVTIDPENHLLVVGPRRSGRTTILSTISRAAKEYGQSCISLSRSEGVPENLVLKLRELIEGREELPPLVCVDGARWLPETTCNDLQERAARSEIALVVACTVDEAQAGWLTGLRDEGTALFLSLRGEQSGYNPVFRVIHEMPKLRPEARFPLGLALYCNQGAQDVIEIPA